MDDLYQKIEASEKFTWFFLESNLLFKKVFASKAYYISNLLLKNYLYAPKRISGKAQMKKLWYTYLQLNVADINLNVIK